MAMVATAICNLGHNPAKITSSERTGQAAASSGKLVNPGRYRRVDNSLYNV
jgi:hypothetical protein